MFAGKQTKVNQKVTSNEHAHRNENKNIWKSNN